MGSHIAQDIRRSGNLWIYPPLGGGCVLLHGNVVETVGELHIYNADLPKHTFFDQLARLLDHLVSGISVGDAYDLILLFCQFF